MWSFHFFIKKPAGATLLARTCLKSFSRSVEKGRLTSYCQVVNCFLNTYATNDIVAEADVDTIIYKQLQDLNAVDYSQSLLTKDLRSGSVYDEYRLNTPLLRATIDD